MREPRMYLGVCLPFHLALMNRYMQSYSFGITIVVNMEGMEVIVVDYLAVE
jgi:hypothetical protein